MQAHSGAFKFHPLIIICISLTDVGLKLNDTVVRIWNGSQAWYSTLGVDPMPEREWVHYLVSWNKIDCRAYKNGKLVVVSKSSSPTKKVHATRFVIGRYAYNKMWLDDLKVWKRPLGEEEAYQVYRSGE